MCTNIVTIVCFTMFNDCLAAVVLDIAYCVNGDCPFAGRSKLQFIAIDVLCRQLYKMYASHYAFIMLY
jgi:hypothetical protein